MNRREYVKSIGIGATIGLDRIGVVGMDLITNSPEVGPPNPRNWRLAFEDTFEGDSLDTSKWEVGYGWGDQFADSPSKVNEEAVEVRDGRLRLSIERAPAAFEKPFHSGKVNTSGVPNGFTFGPGTYLEVRMRTGNLPGANNAFWSKPADEAWPPEIDVAEVPIGTEQARLNVGRSIHNVHYSTSGRAGDENSYEKINVATHRLDSGTYQRSFHTFGCLWRRNRIAHYLDGRLLGETRNRKALTACANGTPFYMLLGTRIAADWLGVPDTLSGFDTTMQVEWVRTYEFAPNSANRGGSGSGDGERYLWVRSVDGGRATYAFEASGGSVELDESGDVPGFWVADDGRTAGGIVSERRSIPGFRYSGEITDFQYSGSPEVFIDGQPVDPALLGRRTEKTITFIGRNGFGSYTVSVTGDIAKSVAGKASIEAGDTISESTASGGVADGGHDTYRFSGDIESIDTDRNVTVLVDGEQYTHVKRVVVTRAPDSSGIVKYSIESSGALEELSETEPDDAAAGSKAHGRIAGGADVYRLTGGTVTDVSTQGGEVVVTVGGDRWRPEEN
jgi:beta-glucanase (GH16 family)